MKPSSQHRTKEIIFCGIAKEITNWLNMY